MKRFLCLLLVLAGSLSVVSCSDDPAIPDISLKLTRVVFEKAKNPALAADIEASINHGDRSVLARLTAGELSSLEPTLYAVGAASYEPVGKQDFTTPVFYTIISTDTFSSLGYMVTVLPGGDAYDVTASRQWLEVGYATGESSTAVSNNVTLVNVSTNGCTITWASSLTNVVITGTTGTVYRPSFTAGNLSVTLTATITKGSASTTKTFTLLIIKQGITDVERVNEDVGAATIGYASGDSSTSITKNLTLPATGAPNGSTFVWTSSNTTIIANDGTVTRPDYGPAGDAIVALHLRGTKNAATANRVFANLKVLQKDDPAITNVAAVKAALAVGYAAGESASAVTNNVTLPTSLNGVTITWASSVPGTITTGGAVTQPTFTAGNATVTLTATLSQTTYSGSPTRTDSKTFVLTVIKLPPTDTEAVDADKAALVIGYASGDSAASITKNVTLATSGTLGTTISWAQTLGTAIATDGTVTRPTYAAGDDTVTLTATIQKGAASSTKDFSGQIVKRLAPSTDLEKVAADKENLAIGYQTGDSATSVTKALTLATAGTNTGVTISWASSDAGVVGTDGTVTRPAIGQPDATVTLTATITSGGESDTKTFELTVKAMQPPYVFPNSWFEADANLVQISGVNITYTNNPAPYMGTYSLHVKANLTSNGDVIKTGSVCLPKGSYTKVVFWIKGKATNASISIFQFGSSSPKDFPLGNVTGDKEISPGSNNYKGSFDLANWTKITLNISTVASTTGAVLNFKGGKNGVYDFYIDHFTYE